MKKTVCAFVLGLLWIVGVISCNPDNNSNTTPPMASFAIINASPSARSIDVFLNGSAVVYNLPYGVDTGYYSVQPTTYTLTIDSAGSATRWYNQSISFEPAVTYSAFVIDSVSNLHTTLVVDSATAPSADSVQLRFLNFSPNTPPVDVALSGTVVSSQRTYNDVASNPGLAKFNLTASGTYTLELRVAGTSNVLLSVPNLVLQGGKIYTLYAKGSLGDIGIGALSVGTVVHNE